MSHSLQSDHFVQFYESDSFLAESVASFIGGALAVGNRAIVIATPEHVRAITEVLGSRSVDAFGAIRRGQLVALDAKETLGKFMVNGSPDPRLFRDAIGPMVARLTEGGRTLRAFGEMVALLVAEGNRIAAIQLEDLWNALAAERAFTLFCAYRMDHFRGPGDAAAFEDICGKHTRVVPSESFAGLAPRLMS
jgi:hypothetical protein